MFSITTPNKTYRVKNKKSNNDCPPPRGSTMAGTFFGLNLLDGFPSSRLTSGDHSSRDEGREERGLGENESFGSFPNSPDEALTHPPAWIHVATHGGGAATEAPDSAAGVSSGADDPESEASSSIVSFSSSSMSVDELGEDSSAVAGGVTILSSVPSSRASFAASEIINSTQMFPLPVTNPVAVDIASSMLSLATTESLYYDNHPAPLSLSVRSSSLASSLDDLTLRSSVAPDRFIPESNHSVGADSASLVTIPVEERDRGAMVPAQHTREPQQRQLVEVRRSSCWFSRLATEDDWDRFHQDALEILCAVKGEYDVADNERMLARLIQQEEAAFWNDPEQSRAAVLRRRQLQKGLVFLGNAALLVAAPLIASSYWGLLRIDRRVH